MKRYIKSSRYDNYFGEAAYNKYADIVREGLSGKVVHKRQVGAEEPGGLIYEANALGIDMWDLLECLEGMCYNGEAREISDSEYKIF